MRKLLACISILLSLSACGQKVEATPAPAQPLPFQTLPPTQTPTVLPALTGIILPTPTTFTYTVVQGDTLSSIAQHLGVSLEALLAANPGISPTSLSVGTKIIIPTGNLVPGEPTPTPATLPIRQTHCWPEADGGLWCLALLQNDYTETLENISAQFSLLDSSGQELSSQAVYGLLDILPPGASAALAAHFAPPAQNYSNVRVQIVTATRLLPGDTRYLPVSVENTLVSVDSSGRTAEVTGRVVLNGKGIVNTLWVLATVYDQIGEVVGVRRWDSPTAWSGNSPASFDFQVSSLGPSIARVEFLAEARP